MKLVVAGDFCPQNRIVDLIEKGKYSYIFSDVKSILAESDFSIANLECPVVSKSSDKIIKRGPNLFCTVSGLRALTWCGFKGVTLANNHIADYGSNGISYTLENCHNEGVQYVGAGNNLVNASKTLFIKIGYQKLAIINCCEHEFSIASENKSGAAPLDIITQFYQIREAKQKADYVIVIVHGGNEHYNLPSPRMKKTYRFFVDSGADAIINHHQHCYSGYEIYNGKPIFYGLGNFCFDNGEKNESKWNEGILLELDLNEKITYNLYPYIQCSINPNIRLLSHEKKIEFYENLDKINAIISNDTELNKRYENFIKNNDNLDEIFEPYSSRFGKALRRRHLIPSFMSKDKRIDILSYIQCESHIDKVLSFLRKD